MPGTLIISCSRSMCGIELSGRVNFETVVPLRDFISRMPESIHELTVDLSECLSMDSTCMGVLSMLALTGMKRKLKMVVLNAGGNRQLLKGLGVEKLFHFEEGTFHRLPQIVFPKEQPQARDMRSAAETVLDAHRVLIDAGEGEGGEANKARFEQVVAMTEEDLKRLSKDK